MVNANVVKIWILAFIATIGGGIANLLGGWDKLAQALILLFVIDILTGIMLGLFGKSPKTKNSGVESMALAKGIAKKVGTLFLVIIAVQFDKIIGNTTFSRSAVIIFLCASESLSVLENLGLMGVTYPSFMKNALEALKDKGDNDAKPTD